MATSCTFHRPTKLCHASDSSIQVRSERHRLSRVYPCLETKCLACKANASNCSACDLAASVILNSFVAPPTCIASLSSSSRLRSQPADLSRFYPCTDSNCISCAANISNCSACNLANGVLLNSYASVPACIAPGAVPSGWPQLD